MIMIGINGLEQLQWLLKEQILVPSLILKVISYTLLEGVLIKP